MEKGKAEDIRQHVWEIQKLLKKASPREREKPLDKVKEPPRASHSLEREER